MNETEPHGRCPAVPVAQNSLGGVAVCPGCGQVHLVLQYLTLRFEPDAFRELGALIAAAQRRIDSERPAGEEPAAPRAAPVASSVH